MKKSLKNMMWIALGAIAFTGCSNDMTEEPSPVAEQGRSITVVASLSDATKAAFTDGETIRWNAGDQIKWSNGATSQELTEADLLENGTKANFTIEVPRNADGWFHSTTTHPGNNNEVEFTLGAGTGYAYTQEKAGVMNARYLFLHSGVGMMQIPAEAETISVSMEIPGSIFRILPYTETFNDEQILQVSMTSGTNLVGTVAYGHDNLSYRGVNDINWQVSKEISVTLGEPFALTGATSRETSKGIYMAVARTTAPLDGYSYTVYTDKAVYSFKAPDKKLEVADNTVKNVFLKLENGDRLGNDEYLYDVRYLGDFAVVENTLWPSEANNNIVNGYWFAQAAPKGTQNWDNKDNINEENKKFYQVTYEIVDNATNAPADWVTCTHPGYGTAWRIALTENNSGKERSATITGRYPKKIEGGYILLDGYETKSVVIRQEAKVDVQAELSEVYTEIIPKEGRQVAAAKLALTINGTAVANVPEALSTYNITISCGTAKTEVAADGTITANFPENKQGNEKHFTLNVNYKGAVIATADFTQEAGEGSEEAFPYTYDLETVGPAFNGSGLGFPANTAHDGNYAFIRNIKLNGELVTLTEEIAATVVAYAFRSTEPTDEEKAAVGQSGRISSATAAVARVRWFGGTQIDVAFQTGAAGTISKVTGYTSDGAEAGYWMVWAD